MKVLYYISVVTTLCIGLLCGTSLIFAQTPVSTVSFVSTIDQNPGQSIRTSKINPDTRVNATLSYFSWFPAEVRESELGSPLSSISSQIQSGGDSPTIEGEALFFPNPFRQGVGAELGYQLSKDADIELIIYNMQGSVIHRAIASSDANEVGTFRGYNRVATKASRGTVGLGLDQLPRLSSSVYFFVLLNNGNILAKGKFAVLP